MAKIGSIERNNKRKKMVKSFSSKREDLKKKIYSKEMSIDERFAFVLKLAKLPRNSAKIRVRNRCFLTGKPRGYYRKVGVSRNVMRDLAGKGMLPGFVKSSW